MTRHQLTVDVRGPWSLATSRGFWEGFAPNALSVDAADDTLRTVFRVDADWSRAEAAVTQSGTRATVTVDGDGDLDAAAEQTLRFLSLDVDATDWPAVGRRDPVVADAQQRLPGLRPCGFHSPYEAATWAVLSQRVRIVQAAKLREDLVRRHGDDGAFPAPEALRGLDLDLPKPKADYLRAVADAALDGVLNGRYLRGLEPDFARAELREIHGIGPFAADLVLVRGASAPDVLPLHEHRLDAEIAYRYGESRALADIADAWRPFRSWAAVHLRALREVRTAEISGGASNSRRT
jgi:DNA-3-methyladenine glycosylase II